jgi:hypothetical protein
MVADVARIAPIMVSGVGKVPLTLTRLNRCGDNKAGGSTRLSRPADARERRRQKKSRQGRLEGQQGGVKQSGQEPLDIQTNWMMRFILWNH